MSAPVVVILAAGQGTRMRSATPKLLHQLCGRPMIAWPIAAARDAGAAEIVVVEGPERPLAGELESLAVERDPLAVERDPVARERDPQLSSAIQHEPRGTGDAVKAARNHIDPARTVIVLNGDVPLVSGETLRALAREHERSGAAATMATAVLDDPRGYGRVVRGPDGTVERVVETKTAGDASELELHIREVNAGIYAFEGAALLAALEQIASENAQGELYLPDVLPVLRSRERSVLAYEIADAAEILGVNDRVQLAQVRAVAQERILRGHMLAGVTVVDPASTAIDVEVTIGADTEIAPFCSIHGRSAIGERAAIGPLTTIHDARVGNGAKIVHSYVRDAEIGEDVSVGPFAYLRPGTVLREGSKAGAFVEIKNSDIAPGAKVPHLSYIGDADIGEGTNIGAGTITANYDGSRKHRTTIGARAFVGVDTMLVAPVTVGDGAYTGGGSVITKDVPPEALGVARARQQNIEGYAQRRKER